MKIFFFNCWAEILAYWWGDCRTSLARKIRNVRKLFSISKGCSMWGKNSRPLSLYAFDGFVTLGKQPCHMWAGLWAKLLARTNSLDKLKMLPSIGAFSSAQKFFVLKRERFLIRF